MLLCTLRIILLCILLPLGLSGQVDYLVDIQRYTVDEGLSHNHVYQTFQDSRGIIWTVTGSGLDRFDGRTFQRMFAFQITNFPFNLIAFEDSDGDLWLREKPVEEKVSTYKLLNIFTGKIQTTAEKYGSTFPERVNNVIKGSGNSFLITSPEGELLRYIPGKKPMQLYHYDGEGLRVLAEEPGKGTIWVVQPGASRLSFTIVGLNAGGKPVCSFDLKDAAWISAFLLPNEILWYGSVRELGFLRLDGASGQVPHSKMVQPYDFPHFANRFHGIWAADTIGGNFWLNYMDRLVVFNPEKGVVFDFSKQANRIFRGTYHIFIDNNQIAWVGTIEGLYKIHLRPNRFRKLFWRDPSDNAENTLTSCRGLCSDNAGRLYAAVDSCIWRVDGKDLAHIYCHPVEFLYANAIDEQGNVWFQCHRYSPQTGRVEDYPLDQPGAVVWSFFPDGNRIWMGRQFWEKQQGTTFSWFSPEDGVLHPFDQYNGFDALEDAEIYFIQKDGAGVLWLATNLGLFSVDEQKGVTGRYWPGGKGAFYLPVENLRHFYRENDSIWWLATNNGLLRWEKSRGNVQQFTTSEGLSHNSLYAVYPDDYGFLWLSSDYGIMQFQKSSGKIRTYTTLDGISHNEFNRISHHQAKDGTIYFGGLNGITAFHPKDFYRHFEEILDIPVVLTACRLFSEQTNREEDVMGSFFQNKKITLQPNDRYLNLQFALTEYIRPSRIEYAYRIEGLSDNWVTIKESRLQLAGLPYGDLTLVIRAKGENGIFSKQELRIPISVLRPIYLQWWFLTLSLSALAMAIVVFFRYRTSQLQQRHIELEEQVKERTEKIRQDKATIRQQTEKLLHLDEMKSRFFANISHELRTPLTMMLGPISTILKKNSLDSQDQSLLVKARQNGQSLLQLVNDILSLVKLESDKMELHEEPTLLLTEIRRIVSSFESHAEQRSIHFKMNYEGDPQLRIQLDRRHFETILNNLLANAFKFTDPDGSVTVWVRDLDSTVQVAVQDTGRGIHLEDLPHVFERFYQSQRPDAPAQGGAGIGLALCVETARLLQGKLWVESTFGAGTVFFLEFPKKEVIGAFPDVQVAKEAPTALAAEDLEQTQTNFSGATPAKDGQRPTILLVEDNRDLREYMELILNRHYEVCSAQNGQDAMRCLQHTPHCQLIVSDIMMPQMDGFQLLEHLRSSDAYRHIPIILLTARAGMEDKLRALRIGVDDYLTKPFEEEELLARIQNLLQHQQIRRTAFQTQNEVGTEHSGAPPAELVLMSKEDMAWLERLEESAAALIGRSNFTVDQLAETLFMARTTFYDQVNRLTGLTPHQYLHEMRLAKARQMLENGAFRTVKELAYAVGFRDEKYFSRQFKKRFGKLPSAY